MYILLTKRVNIHKLDIENNYLERKFYSVKKIEIPFSRLLNIDMFPAESEVIFAENLLTIDVFGEDEKRHTMETDRI